MYIFREVPLIAKRHSAPKTPPLKNIAPKLTFSQPLPSPGPSPSSYPHSLSAPATAISNKKKNGQKIDKQIVGRYFIWTEFRFKTPKEGVM